MDLGIFEDLSSQVFPNMAGGCHDSARVMACSPAYLVILSPIKVCFLKFSLSLQGLVAFLAPVGFSESSSQLFRELRFPIKLVHLLYL